MSIPDLGCRHIYKKIGEYTASGKNILNKRVKAKMVTVVCEKCQEENIRFVSAI